MTSKHTPGPWTAKADDVRDARDRLIAEVWGALSDGHESGSAVANARLIAEAPAMLGELRTLAWIVRQAIEDGTLNEFNMGIEAEESLTETEAILARINEG